MSFTLTSDFCLLSPDFQRISLMLRLVSPLSRFTDSLTHEAHKLLH